MRYDAAGTGSLANRSRHNRIGLRVLRFRHRGVTRLSQRRHVIDVNSQAQTTHLIAPNRTHSMSMSKSETNKVAKRRCHSERSEESLDISATAQTNDDQRCFAEPVLSETEGLNMTRKPDERSI